MTHETDAIVTRIMSIRNGMIVDADAEALIRDALDARQTSPVSARAAIIRLLRTANVTVNDQWEGSTGYIGEGEANRLADAIDALTAGVAKLIADKAAEPAFVEFAKNMPQLNEVLYLPIFKVGPTAVTHWRVALMSGREIGLSDDELKTAVSQSSTDRTCGDCSNDDLVEVVIACCNGQMGREAAVEVISELRLAGFKIVSVTPPVREGE